MTPDSPPIARAVRCFDSVHRDAPTQWQFCWHFAAGDAAFAGHFPHHPILPGVFLLEMAQRAAEWALRRSLGAAYRVSRLQRMRFTAPVLPGDRCTLLVRWDADPASGASIEVVASFSKGDAPVAHGSLCAVRAEVEQ